MNLRCLTLVAMMLAGAFPAIAQTTGSAASDLAGSVAKQMPALKETYKHLHRNPELSHHEEKTSALLASELRKLGYTVTERVGKYPDGSHAYGVVAVLQNGAGPHVLIRADMDALPVEEKTGLDYASRARSTNAQGQDVGVMHACGHDIHVTVLLGAARELVAHGGRMIRIREDEASAGIHAFVDFQVRELRNVFRDRVRGQPLTLLVKNHHGNAGDRLGHRKVAEDHVLCHGCVGGKIARTVGLVVDDFAVAGEDGDDAGYLLLIDALLH
jgi:hypothetical protein